MNNNYNLPQVPQPVYYPPYDRPQVPQPVYYPPYDRPPPYNPEYYQNNQTYQTYQIPISNSHNAYPSQYYNQPTHIQRIDYNDNRTKNNNDKSCLYVFLGAICCCFFIEEENY
jgi:hypothetical protein